MSQALYRKYRSKSLDDVVGQGHVTNLLRRALETDRVAHAYLLTGPRGVGKTSVARILAHEINKLPYTDESTHLDIIEIDAASNNGVDDVRELREKARLAPTSAKKKVYIIDEVHMLSKPAFNALLKTLEEPPEHVVFILATTDVEKLPATIISRTQRYGFRAINTEDAVAHLKSIAEKESIKIDDAALTLIAERGDGSFRDSISLLDQLSSLADEKQGITAELVESSLGLAPATTIADLLSATESSNFDAIVSTLDTVTADGIDAGVLAGQLAQQVRSTIASKPQLLPLLDKLLEVGRSSHPGLKLLTVLGEYAAPAPAATQPSAPATPKTPSAPKKPHDPSKTVALEAPVMEVSASVEELTQEVAEEAPKRPRPTHDGPVAFDWAAMLAHAKEHYVALHSVLSKCGHEIEGDLLTLYTNNAFYKKKLDDAKYNAHLHETLKNIGSEGLLVNTIPESAPLKDSQAAGVAAIMGGGVEVSLDAA